MSTKTELREWAATRPRPSAEETMRVNHHLHRHLVGRLPETIVGYHALGDEVDLGRLVTLLPGWRWLFPRVTNGTEMTLHDHGGHLERHRLGMDQPTSTGPVVDPIRVEVVLVPGLLFSADGTRLGRGTGHYDRLLARIPDTAERIGVTITSRLRDDIPRDTHDVMMTAVVTESGLDTVG